LLLDCDIKLSKPNKEPLIISVERGERLREEKRRERERERERERKGGKGARGR